MHTHTEYIPYERESCLLVIHLQAQRFDTQSEQRWRAAGTHPNPCAGSITCTQAGATCGMTNIFLYIAVNIMYFLAMALHCQCNKHIILSSTDNCAIIHKYRTFIILWLLVSIWRTSHWMWNIWPTGLSNSGFGILIKSSPQPGPYTDTQRYEGVGGTQCFVM